MLYYRKIGSLFVCIKMVVIVYAYVQIQGGKVQKTNDIFILMLKITYN